MKRVNELTGIKESDTGLAPPALWDLAADKQTLQNEQPLQVGILYTFIFGQCQHGRGDEPMACTLWWHMTQYFRHVY